MHQGVTMKTIWKIMSYVAAVLAGAILVVGFLPVLLPTESIPNAPSKLDQLEDIIDTYHVDKVDRTALEDAAAEAMVGSAGDRWSFYIPASQYQSFLEQNANAYVGIGVTIQLSDEKQGLEIIDVTPNSPAYEAGLRTHDVIMEADGQNCYEIGLDKTTEIVKGKEGTDVTLTIARDGEEFQVTVTRKRVEVPVATSKMLDSGYGLITIENFDSKCAQETISAIDELMMAGAKGIIFDVRFNPGGYVHELVYVLDYILPEGLVFKSVAYDGEETLEYSDAGHISIPLAVLVNGDSYSAAEFFAAALQEYQYAIVIGQQTTGKGYYQTTFKLDDGSAANISIGKYYTPKGVNLEGTGITPDVPVEVTEEVYASIYYGELDPEEDPQIQAAISALESAKNP